MRQWFTQTAKPAAEPQFPERGPFDAVVIGGGHNGLVCAGYLAQGGLRVVLCEAKDRVGGACVTRDFADGFRVSAGAQLVQGLHPRIVRDLKLQKYGLKFAAKHLAAVTTDGEGGALRWGGEVWQMQQALQAVSAADAEALPGFVERCDVLADIVAAAMREAVPVAAGGHRSGGGALKELRDALGTLDRDVARTLMRHVMAASADILDESFETDLFKGLVAADSVIGMAAGPRWPGSMLSLLARGSWRHGKSGERMALPEGGLGALTDALEAAARAEGVIIRTNAPVVAVEVRDERASGVVLGDGELIKAPLVVSGASPQTTLLNYVGARKLDTGFAKTVRSMRSAGVTAKLHLALDGLPDFVGLEQDDLMGRIVICPDVSYAERAYAPYKYGGISNEPILDVMLPTLHDLSLAPIGQHVLTAIVQYVPREIEGGWDAQRDGLMQRVIDTLAYFAPDLKDRIIAGELLTPPDIEAEFGVPNADWHHAAFALDQWGPGRPWPGARGSETPIAGLYLCGAGIHPGGGVTGIPGYLAAAAVTAEAKQRARGRP